MFDTSQTESTRYHHNIHNRCQSADEIIHQLARRLTPTQLNVHSQNRLGNATSRGAIATWAGRYTPRSRDKMLTQLLLHRKGVKDQMYVLHWSLECCVYHDVWLNGQSWNHPCMVHTLLGVLAFSIGLHLHWVDKGCTYHWMMLWWTGGVLVEGDQGLNCRVKARANHLTMFFFSFSNMHKSSTPHDWSLVHTPTMQFGAHVG